MENVHYLPVVTPDYIREEYEELPREEALTRLYMLRDHYGQSVAHGRARSVCEAHALEFGHFLRSGCCANQPDELTAA